MSPILSGRTSSCCASASRSIHCLEPARARWLATHESPPEDPSFLSYVIVDGIVDGYFPVLESLRTELESVEDKIFASVDQGFLESVFALKKQLLCFRRVVNPLRDIFSVAQIHLTMSGTLVSCSRASPEGNLLVEAWGAQREA